ncbi:hypothetical protein VPH35_056012 [Triticum aestivum]
MNSLKVAETIITREYPNGMDATQVDQFKTSFVCFIMDFWGSLLTPNEIPSYNFCSAAIDEIMNTARKAQYELKTKKSIKYVSSCPLLLQAFVLDSLNLGILNIPDYVVPTISAFDCEKMSKMIELVRQKSDNDSFGSNKLKSFRNRKQIVPNEAATKYKFASVTMNKPPFIPNQGTSKPAAVQTTSHAKRPLNIFLDSYVQGTTPKKLSVTQIIDLKWHSARIIRHMNEFKSIAQPICNNPALATSATDNLSAKIDNLLEIILNDNLELAKRLHEHVPAIEVRSEGPPKCKNSLKRSGSEYSGADSNSDCTSKKIDSSKSKMFQIAGNMDATRTPCSNTSTDFENVQTPRNELSPATVASRMSETAVAFRLFQREDILNLNARALEAEFTDSPIDKIKVSNGQLASNHVLVGTTMLQKSSAMLAIFSNWVLHSKQDKNEVCWIINYEPRRSVQLEMLIYGTSKKQRCRHIMESDFAVMVLGNENVMSSRSILDQFRKIAIFYDISECRTIIVPALVNVTWCSYFLDMMLKCVHVADPMYVRSNEIELKKMHESNVKKILCAMTKVVKELYSGWEVDFTTWDTNYLKPIIDGFTNTEMFDSDDSGLVTIISIRDFHGDTIIGAHTQETIMSFKPLLLYELMSIKGNHGTVPTSYIETIDD